MSNPAPAFLPPGPIKISVDEYMEFPNDGKRYQIFDGEPHVTPSPVPEHQEVSLLLETILVRALQERGEGKVFHAPIDVILDRHNIVQPDILFIRSDRLKIICEKNIQGPPDLVIEILSQSTRRTDVLTKSELYARFGVTSYWIVDPEIDRIDFYRLEGRGYHLLESVSAPAVAHPTDFPSLEIPLAAIFKP